MRTTPAPAARLLGALLAAGALAGCAADRITALNAPTVSNYTPVTTRAQVQQLATGVADADRQNYATQVVIFSIVGRDLYRIDASEPRWASVLLDQRTPDNSGFVGGALWTDAYQPITAATFLIRGAGATSVLSAAEKSAVTGYAQTMQGLSYLSLVRSRDTLGIPVQAVVDSLVPIRCKPAALAYVSALLDSGATALAAAGATAFPFALPPGFSSNGAFTTPAAFLQFNRGLKGIVEMYRGMLPLEQAGDPLAAPDAARMAAALAAFDSSFYAVPTGAASLGAGVYYTFGTASGETANPLANTTVFRANPSVVAEAEPGDPRFAAKVDTSNTAPISITINEDTVQSRYGVRYPRSATDPLALLKNSELVLSRAQVLWTLGRDAEALALVNAVRQANGLAPKTAADFASRLDLLIGGILHEKRYELLFESPTRWVDFRNMGMLARAGLEFPNAGGRAPFPALPIPNNEATSRNGNIACQP